MPVVETVGSDMCAWLEIDPAWLARLFGLEAQGPARVTPDGKIQIAVAASLHGVEPRPREVVEGVFTAFDGPVIAPAGWRRQAELQAERAKQNPHSTN